MVRQWAATLVAGITLIGYRHPIVFAQTTVEPSATPFSVDAQCINRPTPCAFGEFEFVAASTPTTRACCIQSRCREGIEYQIVPPTPTTDRFCTPYRTECPAAFFLAGDRSATSDRECQPCQICPPTMFESATCDDTVDTTCSPHRQCVAGSQFESAPPTATSDRNCSAADTCSTVLQFESAPLTATTDRACAALSQCVESIEFQQEPPSSTTDRLCRPYTAAPCTNPQFEAAARTSTSDRLCLECRTCGANQFEIVQCTSSSNRQCRDLTVCDTPHQFEVDVATLSTDRVCRSTQQCAAATEFQSQASTATSDATCTPFLTSCPGATQFLAGQTTPTSDRTCTQCTECEALQFTFRACSTFSDAECRPVRPPCEVRRAFERAAPTSTTDRICVQLDTCAVTGEFEVEAATLTSDRQCAALTICNASEFESVASTVTSDRSCGELRQCQRGTEFESQPPTPTTDRSCETFMASCPSTEHFFVGDQTPTSDRTCQPCTNCTATQYAALDCTLTSDRDCRDLATCNPLTEFEAVSPTTTSNRVCMALDQCSVSEFIERQPTASSNRLCSQYTICGEAEFQGLAPTITSDRVCTEYLAECPAPNHFFATQRTLTSDRVCEACRPCVSDQYECAPCTTTSNRQCCDVAFCRSHEFEVAQPTASSNRQCRSLTTCTTDTEFEVLSPTVSSDRRCNSLRTCRETEYEAHPGTANSNRVCAPYLARCPQPDHFLSGVQTPTSDRDCRACTVCPADLYAIRQCGTEVNTVCSDVSVCSAGQFQSRASTLTSDRICSVVRNCTAGFEFQVAEPTATSDRECRRLSTCAAGLRFEASGPTATTDRVCLALTTCRSNEFISRVAGPTSDRQCTQCSAVCSTSPTDLILLVDSSASVDFPQHGGIPGNYQLGLNFLADIVGQLPIAQGIVRVAAVTFSTTASTRFNFLTFSSAAAVEAAVRQLPYDGGVTNTHLGVEEMRSLLQPAAGFRSSARLAILLITDGPSTNSVLLGRQLSALAATSASDRYVIAVGLPTTPPDLLQFAGSVSNMFHAPNYSVISSAIQGPVLDVVCTSNCPAGQFEQAPCTAISDLVCANLTVCEVSEFEIVPASRSSDRRCAELTSCNSADTRPAEFEVRAPTATSNRVCASVQNCTSNEFESNTPTPTSDRICTAIHECEGGQTFQGNGPTVTSDRQCFPCRRCSADEFETSACTVNADRTCALLSTCGIGEFEALPPTSTSNRVCQNTTSCNFTSQFELDVPSFTTDRRCAPVSTCVASEYTTANATVTSDRVCTPCTECPEGQYRGTPCTQFVDATCAPCTQTCVVDPLDLVFLIDDSQSIENPVYGGQPGNYVRGLNFLASVVGDLPDTSGLVRVAAITFSTVGTVHFDFNGPAGNSSLPAVQNALRALPRTDGVTNTHLAFTALRTILNRGAGFRGFNDTNLVIVLLTDGVSNDLDQLRTELALFDQLSAGQARRLVIGVGLLEQYRPLLRELAGSTGSIFVEESYLQIDAAGLHDELVSTLCSSSCDAGEFEMLPCGDDHDRVCAAATTCSEGEFEVAAPTATGDRQCSNLFLCNPLPNSEPAPVADPRCTLSDHPLCLNLNPSNCTSPTGNESVAEARCPFLCNECGKYESIPGTATSDRTCAFISQCDLLSSFVSAEATPTTDRVCQRLTECIQGVTFETTPPSYNSNRVCASCTECLTATQYETASCSATSDRTCSNLTVCATSEFETMQPTATSDRRCAPITVCDSPPVAYLETSATSTSDAVCAPCTSCISTAADLLFIIDTSSSIEEPAFGGSAGTFNFVRSFVRNVTMSIPNVGPNPSNGTRVAAITFDSVARIAFDFGGGLVGPPGSNLSAVIDKVDTLLTYGSGGSTNTSSALRLARQVLFNTSQSDSTGFRNFEVPVILVLVTDGHSDSTSELTTELDALNNGPRERERAQNLRPNELFNVSRYAFGVGLRQLDTELILIAEGNSDASFEVGSFGVLEAFTETVLTETALCRHCPLGQFLAAPCTSDSDVQCLSISASCGRNEFEAATPTATSDRQCDPTACVLGDTHFDNAGSCTLCRNCQALIEFEATPCTSTADRICNSVSRCNAPAIEVLSPSPTSDRICSDFCASNQFAAIIDGAVRCTNQTACAGDEFEFLPPTPLADRTCIARTLCHVGLEFESASATPSTNRQCSSCTTCRNGSADIVFLVDASSSVCSDDGGQAFSRTQAFLSASVRSLPLSADQIRVGIVSYSSQANVILDFDRGSNLSAAVDAIDNMTCSSGARRTDIAIQLAREHLLNPFTSRRARVPAILVFVGPGGSTLPFATQAEMLNVESISQVATFAITVRAADTTELLLLAGGDSSHVVQLASYTDLSQSSHSLFTDDVCDICLAHQYLSVPCGGVSDNVCRPVQTCNSSAYASTAPSQTSDRECEACSTCSSGHFESVSCTTTTNTQCSVCRDTCPPFTFESIACSPTTDRACEDCSFQCSSGSFFVAPCSPTADIRCAPCTTRCPSDRFISTLCTPNADTQCSLTTLCGIGQFESAPPAPLRDRECRNITQCGQTEYQVRDSTVTSDRQCAEVTTCAAAFLEDEPPTATSDRSCVFSGVCDVEPRVFDLVWMLDASGSVSESDFNLMKEFVSGVTARETIGQSNVQVATVLFHDTAELVFSFTNGTDRETVVNQTRDIPFSGFNRGTALATALQFVDRVLLQPALGRRQGVPARIVIITDGRASETQATLAGTVSSLTSNHDVLISAVGIGNADRTQLTTIASGDEIVFSLGDFPALGSSAFFNLFESRVFGCERGTFETSPCTATGPRVCTPCTTSCPSGQFLSGSCVGTQDAQCLNCTACRTGTFESAACGGTSDTTCTTCTQRRCSAGFFATPCTSTEDSFCLGCATCAAGNFELRPCTGVNDTQCAPCRAQCGEGEFEAISCGLNGLDRQCHPCSRGCPVGQFEFQECSAARDTVCAPCTSCDSNQYELAPCTPTTDAVCAPQTVCGATGQYEVSAATSTSDSVCAICTSDCGAGSYISAACSAQNNTVCSECTECVDGDFPSRGCNGVDNNDCQPCTAHCPPRHFRVAECSPSGTDLQCSPCTLCGTEQFEAVPCSEAGNSLCVRCRETCISGFFEATPCSGTTDRTCTPCATCGADQYIARHCETSADTMCHNCTPCTGGFRETSPCTATSDRVCTPCDPCAEGHFRVATCNATHPTQCAPCNPTACSVGDFESSPCTSTANRECRACAECSADHTMLNNCSLTSNVQCTPCVCCADNEYEVSACTASTQTVCAACAQCVRGESYARTPCGDTCVQCSPPCNASSYEILECSGNHDRQCVDPIDQFDTCVRSYLNGVPISGDSNALASAENASVCSRRCLDRPSCTGFAFSVNRRACLLLASYEISGNFNVPASSDFVYCRRQPRSTDVLRLNSLPLGFLGSATAGVRLSEHPEVGRTFSIGVSFRLPPGGFGYLVSNSNTAGNLRYYALYCTLNGRFVDFYYTGSDNLMRRERFNSAVADGRPHTLSVMVRHGDSPILQFVLDGRQAIRHLPVSDLVQCQSDCVATIGMRSSSNAAGGRYFFGGRISQLYIFPSSAIPAAVLGALASTQTPSMHQALAAPAIFNGSSALRFTNPPGQFDVSGNVTVYMAFQQDAGTSGYIFAKANPTGQARYLALYSRPGVSRAMWLFYVTRGVTQRVVFNHAVSDGALHIAELTLSPTTARLVVDGVAERASLEGPVEDCGVLASSCILSVGDRPPAHFRFEGSIFDLAVGQRQLSTRLC